MSVSPIASRSSTPERFDELKKSILDTPRTSSTEQSNDSRVDTHPDAPEAEKSTCCLVSCFIGIKNCFVGFFDWVCGLFKSKEEKELEEECPGLSKLPSPARKALVEYALKFAKPGANQLEAVMELVGLVKTYPEIMVILPEKQRKLCEHLSGDVNLFNFQVVLGSQLKKRYKVPESVEQSWIYLADLNRIYKHADAVRKLATPQREGAGLSEEEILQILPEVNNYIQAIQKELATEMPKTETDEMMVEVGEMINEAPVPGSSLFTFMQVMLAPAVTDALIVFANRVRSNQLEPIPNSTAV